MQLKYDGDSVIITGCLIDIHDFLFEKKAKRFW